MGPQRVDEDAEESVATTSLMGEGLEPDADVPFYIDAGSGGEGTPHAPSSNKRRRRPYLPTLDLKAKCKGSLHLAFLSHACFITASLFYVRLSFVDLAWIRCANENDVPREVLDADDDEVWDDWADAHANGAIVAEVGDIYDARFKMLYTLGALFFMLVGVLDWMRYCDVLNVFMILAGAAGVASGVSDTNRGEDVWDCVSVHLYLLEAFNLLRREHEYDGHACFRVGDVCFLVGSILDILGSYLSLAGFEGLAAYYMDMVACFLWLACSLIDLAAEVYFLKKARGSGRIFCY